MPSNENTDNFGDSQDSMVTHCGSQTNDPLDNPGESENPGTSCCKTFSGRKRRADSCSDMCEMHHESMPQPCKMAKLVGVKNHMWLKTAILHALEKDRVQFVIMLPSSGDKCEAGPSNI